MPITVKLQGMHSYSLIVIIVIAVIMAVSIIVFLCIRKKTPKKEAVLPVQRVRVVNTNMIKQKYSAMLYDLEKKCYDNKISNRYAYQELSRIIRNFVYEATGIKVCNFTLEEIKKVNMPKLYAMVEECYTPEFAIDSNGNIAASIKKARKVIEEWN